MIAVDSIAGIADVETLFGADASPEEPPALLVEVPHGADRRAHYDLWRARLVGTLPEDLHAFFHVNTDVGAWQYGRRVAERLVDAEPGRSALVVRCLVPRTFVDTNRLEDAKNELGRGGLSAGLAPYVRDERDQRALVEAHRLYIGLVERAYELVCGRGGFALSPHTYAPKTVGIEQIDDDIVSALRAAYEPEAYARWPERPPIDLITRTADGSGRAPAAVVEALLAAWRARGIAATENGVYHQHPSTQGWRFTERYPDQVLALEVRRDLLVEAWTPFEEMRVSATAADAIAEPLADAIGAWLRAR